MWDEVGLLRTGEGLTHALRTLRAWSSSSSAPTTASAHEDANLLLLAEATASAALARTVSVGAHHRVDAPIPEPGARSHAPSSILETV
ncbi:L-aspartate oxidase, partial [Microbacterium maritypicum]